MPIRRELRKYYGASWQAFRLELIAELGSICQQCGIELARGINGAHTGHDPRDRSSVRLMCPGCHAAHDAGHRLAIMRRTRARKAGQLWLLPEMEWAPFASFEIPGWIHDRLAQLRLFDSY